MTHARRLAAAGALALLVLAPTAALAADPISEAVAGLRTSPVFTSDPSLSAKDADALRAHIAETGDQIYVAVIPQVADYDNAPRNIGRALAKPGTFAVVSGKHFRAGSSAGGLNSGQAGQLATEAFNAHNPGVEKSITPMLQDFVSRVHSAIVANRSRPNGAGSGTASSAPQPSKSRVGEVLAWVFGGLAALVALIFAGLGLKKRSERKRQEEAERKAFEAAKRTAAARLNGVSDAILKYEGLARPNPQANALLSDVTAAYGRANSVWTSAQTVEEVQAIMPTIEQAESDVEDVKAYLDGRDPQAERAEQEKKAAKAAAERERRAAKKREQEEKEAAERRKWEDKVSAGSYTATTTQTTTNTNYFGGGYYGGMYYGPGYYSDPFWNYMMMDSLLDHDQQAYDNGDHGNYDDQPDTSNSGSYGGTDGGDWDTPDTSPSYSGGGDWGSSSSDSGGYDSGGGDSGGGGGDW